MKLVADLESVATEHCGLPTEDEDEGARLDWAADRGTRS
jgi:hypothetical protein